MNKLEMPFPDSAAGHYAQDEPAADGTVEPLREAAGEAKTPHWLAAHRTEIFGVLAVVVLLLFGTLTVLVSDGLTNDTDLIITLAVQSLTALWVAWLMIGVNWIGFPPQAPLLVGGVAVLFRPTGYRADAGFSVAAAASCIFTETIKHVVCRTRPTGDLIHGIAAATGQHFPS